LPLERIIGAGLCVPKIALNLCLMS
jgi:hypothetical protein